MRACFTVPFRQMPLIGSLRDGLYDVIGSEAERLLPDIDSMTASHRVCVKRLRLLPSVEVSSSMRLREHHRPVASDPWTASEEPRICVVEKAVLPSLPEAAFSHSLHPLQTFGRQLGDVSEALRMTENVARRVPKQLACPDPGGSSTQQHHRTCARHSGPARRAL